MFTRYDGTIRDHVQSQIHQHTQSLVFKFAALFVRLPWRDEIVM